MRSDVHSSLYRENATYSINITPQKCKGTGVTQSVRPNASTTSKVHELYCCPQRRKVGLSLVDLSAAHHPHVRSVYPQSCAIFIVRKDDEKVNKEVELSESCKLPSEDQQ